MNEGGIEAKPENVVFAIGYRHPNFRRIITIRIGEKVT
jgi:hypothetical protein